MILSGLFSFGDRAIWIRRDRPLVLLRQPVQVVQVVQVILPALLDLQVQRSPPDQMVPQGLEVQRLQERPAGQRDLGYPYRLSARVDPVDRLVLQSSQRAPGRLRAQLPSRSAYEAPLPLFLHR